MNRRAATLAWTLFGLSLILLTSSVLGHGTGLFGRGMMVGMMWSYVVLLAALVGVFAFAGFDARDKEAQR